jgi:undecaprenyl-diphosphatase
VLGGVWLGLTEPHVTFGVVVHVATLGATAWVYRQDLKALFIKAFELLRAPRSFSTKINTCNETRLLAGLVCANIPTAFIGLVFKDELETLFSAPKMVGCFFGVTALLLWTTRGRMDPQAGLKELGLRHALLIGAVQGLAIIPGISRSGSTIACALLLGAKRNLAARFSFLMAMPAIGGALLLKGISGELAGAIDTPTFIGFVSAALTGVVALKLLIPLIQRGKLYLFAPYLVVIAIFSVVLT